MKFTFYYNKNKTSQHHDTISENLYETLYYLISDLKTELKNINPSITIFVKSPREHIIMKDILTLTQYNNNMYLISNTSELMYNINNINSLKELIKFYNQEHQSSNKFYEFAISNILNQSVSTNSTNSKKIHQSESTNLANSANSVNLVQLSSEMNDVIENINVLDNVFKSKNEKLIEKVKFKDEDKSQFPSWKNDFVNPKYDPDYLECESESGSECESGMNLENLEELEKQIELMEKMKDVANSIINNNEKIIEEDKENLSKYHCLVVEQEFNEKKEREKLEEEYNKFISERDYTYGKIYEKFFVKKQIKDWDCVPPFFMLKFPIFVYLNGKDLNGENVRESILYTKDDFRMYKLMYDALVNPDFEMPDDEDDSKIIIDFLDSYPPIPIMSEYDIMLELNKYDNKNAKIFEEDETSMCSCDTSDVESE